VIELKTMTRAASTHRRFANSTVPRTYYGRRGLGKGIPTRALRRSGVSKRQRCDSDAWAATGLEESGALGVYSRR